MEGVFNVQAMIDMLRKLGYKYPDQALRQWVTRGHVKMVVIDGAKFYDSKSVSDYISKIKERKTGRAPGKANGTQVVQKAQAPKRNDEIMDKLYSHTKSALAIAAKREGITIYDMIAKIVNGAVDEAIADAFK